MKINVLDSSVYNRISAGEVVENPASVVKELIENAVDAGASSVSVRIEDGGVKYIEVSDNGCGIEKSELPKAILAHATSKISEADDLLTISTLGFRGEALASIAAVSEIEILTRYADDDCGSLLKSKDGKITVSDAACNTGTCVKVKNLFYNTPARYKFLASKTTEESYVTRYVMQFILSNPDVAIEYFADGDLVYSSSGEGMRSAVEAVFVPKIVDNFIEIKEIPNSSGISVTGYTSSPAVFKNNRTQQTLIINGRIVYDQTVSATVLNAYGERLMNRCFPIYVLNIVMPFDEVDVNVHPNKKEVRFGNARKVYSAVYHAVKEALDAYEERTRGALLTDNLFDKGADTTGGSYGAEGAAGKEIKSYKTQPTFSEEKTAKAPEQPAMSLADALKLVRGNASDATTKLKFNEPSASVLSETKPITLPHTQAPVSPTKTDKAFAASAKSKEAEQESFLSSAAVNGAKAYRAVGQLFNTYLVIECGDKVLFIDQHAMHERILFDELMNELASEEVAVQPLMLPYVYETTAETAAAFAEFRDELKTCGFETEEFGRNAVKISTVPATLGEVDIGVMMAEVTEGLVSGKLPAKQAFSRNKLASAACKAAIKGGDEMSEEQIALVMDYFAAGKMPLQCPHGRPTAIVYSRYEFEKLFRRKV